MAVKGRKAQNAAAAARARMSKRAERQRWWKENKKRLTIAFVFLIILTFVAFFTPLGPSYYRNKINDNLLTTDGRVTPGSIAKLYKLGVFYHYSFRLSQAQECYDEIGRLFFGFKITDFALDEEAARLQRETALANIKKNLISGPPYGVDDDEIKYAGFAIWRIGEIIEVNSSRLYTVNLYEKLYIETMEVDYKQHCDPDVNSIIHRYVDKARGRR